jgi:hypothetical protein
MDHEAVSPTWSTVLGRLLLACALSALLGPWGQAWAAGPDSRDGGEDVALATAEALPPAAQALPQVPAPPDDEQLPPRWNGIGGSIGARMPRSVPADVARPEPWLRHWRSVALLR